MPTRRLVPALALAAALLAACTSTTTPGPDITHTSTVVTTRTPAPTFAPKPAHSVDPLPPGASPAAGEVERACPYIASTPDDNPAVNVADIEGDHVYRTVVLTTLKPVGCRFYFYAGPFEAIADIVPTTFATANDAYNAMILTARAGSEQIGQKSIIPGVDAVLYRTQFFGPDGAQDWACAFAKGKLMVVVHTQRTDLSNAALLLAQAIAPKI